MIGPLVIPASNDLRGAVSPFSCGMPANPRKISRPEKQKSFRILEKSLAESTVYEQRLWKDEMLIYHGSRKVESVNWLQVILVK